MEERIRVYVADDHQIIIMGLREQVKIHNESSSSVKISVVGEASNSEKLYKDCVRKDIDVFLIDLGFDSTKGDVSVVRTLRDLNPGSRIVVFSMRKNIATITACYRYGALAFISKADEPDELIKAIFSASKGDAYYAQGLMDRIGIDVIHNPLADLADREKTIFLLLAQGKHIKVVEREVGLSEKTINNIITEKIKPVLGVSRKGFREYAIKNGILEIFDSNIEEVT